jgi:tetratricopeptide (TPR) repeat protein
MTEESKPSIEQLRKLIAQNPNDSEAHSLLGNALYDRGLPGEAISSWQQALRLNCKNDHAYFCICLLINGNEPLVEPTAELLNFLSEFTDGHYLKLGKRKEQF